MKQGYIKHFNDGQSETIFDTQVRRHRASWRNGRLDGLVAVDLHHNLNGRWVCMTLNAGEGEWWQSDTMLARYIKKRRTSPIEFLGRRIERKITSVDVGKFLVRTADESNFVVRLTDKLPKATGNAETIKIHEGHVDKWLCVELSIKDNGVRGVVLVTFRNEKL